MSDADSELLMVGLSRSDLEPDPFRQFEKWFQRAIAAGVKLPEAMTLATATENGKPSARMVLLKGFDERGFVFYTNYESQKGRELEANPQAALVFYWSELDRQIRITGAVEEVSREESENYFRTRPLDSQLSAWASKQSEVIGSRKEMEDRMSRLIRDYEGRQVPLPSYWGGYRLAVDSIEFWQNRAGRLHDRFRYTRQSDSGWLIERLSP